MARVVSDLPLIEREDGSKDLTDDLECDLKGDSSDGKSDSLMADISTLTLSTANSDGPSEEGRTSSSRDDDWSLETTWLIEGSSSKGLLSLSEIRLWENSEGPEGGDAVASVGPEPILQIKLIL
jgi:hypothetical protein